MVRSRDARWFQKLAVAGAMLGLVGLGACGESLTAPVAAPLFDGRGGEHHDRDEHEGRGCGRSGSAAMTVVAALGSDGVTEVLVTTYRATDLSFLTPVGCIKKVQVKVLNGDRRHDDNDDERTWTRNYNHLDAGSSYTVRLTNVRVGDRIKVKVLVGCIDGRRTDVLDATATLIRRTDPAVMSVNSSLQYNTWSLITAVVTELRGQQGAAGRCYLSVDGAAEVVNPDVLVIPAGGSVQCFWSKFLDPSVTHRLVVRFGDVTPRDDNLLNNLGAFVVPSSVPGGVPTAPTFSVSEVNVKDATVYDYEETLNTTHLLANQTDVPTDANLIYKSYSLVSRPGQQQSANLTARLSGAVSFPMTLTVSQSSGTATYHTETFPNVMPGDASGTTPCSDLLSGGAIELQICAYYPTAPEQPYTMITYRRKVNTATLTRAATEFDKNALGCDALNTDSTAVCYKYSFTQPGQASSPSYQGTYIFRITLATGTQTFSWRVDVPLALYESGVYLPYTCFDPTFDEVTGGYHRTQFCEASDQREVGKGGQTADLYVIGP